MLQPYFALSVATDRIYHTRAKLQRGMAVPLPERFINYVYETAWLPATYTSPIIAREFLRSVQMREPSGVWMQLRVSWHMLRAWLSGFLKRRTAPIQTPPRAEFLRMLASSNRVQE